MFPQEELEQLESTVRSTQFTLSCAHAKRKELLNIRSQVVKQCSTCSRALEAILSVTRLLPAASSASSHQPKAESASERSVATAPSLQTPAANSLAVAITHGQRELRRSFFERSGRVPRPLTSFCYHRAINVDNLLTHQNSAHSVGREVDYRRLAHQFQIAEATKCGCGISDIAWYCTTHITVARGADSQRVVPKDEAGVCGECNNVDIRSQQLSLSTTFSSGPCIASFILLYFHLSVENILSKWAVKTLDGKGVLTLTSIVFTVVLLGLRTQHACVVSRITAAFIVMLGASLSGDYALAASCCFRVL
jgi:hypothetical protein